MEHVYAVGIDVIQYVQERFANLEGFFHVVNEISCPFNAFEFLFPLIAIFDSAFAAQYLLSISFGQWFNTLVKWWMMEERPYWWVHETDFYKPEQRPQLAQFEDTCETSPGCPSGHTLNMAMLLVLLIMWISHILGERKSNILWWKYLVYPAFTSMLGAVMLGRMFIAAQFPHQCMFGAGVGLFLAPALCMYIIDPHIWGERGGDVNMRMCRHGLLAVGAGLLAVLTYGAVMFSGTDPHTSVELAHRWCKNSDDVLTSANASFVMLQAVAYMIGWAIAVSPDVAMYRYCSQRRSLIVATAATLSCLYVTAHMHFYFGGKQDWLEYIMHFVIFTLKPSVYIIFVPFLATLPYRILDAEDAKNN